MNTEVSTAKPNLIIEAAGGLIQAIVDAIAAPATIGTPPVPNPAHNAAWLLRYPSIIDLNVVTAKSTARRVDTIEKIDRWPWCGFLIDEVRPSPLISGEEHFIASLLCLIGVESEVFSMASQEIYEIHHHIRSILLSDKSLGGITGIGGVIDHISWTKFLIPVFDELRMRAPTLVIQSQYEIAFREVIYR